MATVAFFSPSDVFSLGADWAIQSGANPNVTRQRAQALGADGDEIASAQYGAQEAVSCTYKAKKLTGSLVVPQVGKIANGYHIDSVQVAYSQTDFPTMTVTGHKHYTAAGVAKTHDECRKYQTSLTFPARAIGCPETGFGFTLPSGLGVRSVSVSIQCNHVDEAGSDGTQLAGDNYDGSESVAVELTGEATLAELSIQSGWALPESFAKNQSNTGATTTSFTITKHLAHVATSNNS